MNETNWNNVEKHYREKCEEIKQILNTIPLNAQMRTQSKLVINKDLEPVVILFCDFKKVKIDALHSVIAYDKERQRWMDAVYIPQDADPERYIVYAPVEWELTPFIQVRIDPVIDYFNRKGKQPQDRFTAHVLVGDWEPYKDDNLISVIHLFDMWFANLSLEFVQTEDASKAVFYYDWNDHEYKMMDDTDTSDPLQYTMYCIADSCKYAPKNIDLTAHLYTLNCGNQVMPKIIFQSVGTKPMTEAELDTLFPNVRQQLEKEAAERYEQ